MSDPLEAMVANIQREACFTDANGRKVRVGDRVQFRDGRNGTMAAIFQDGSGYVRFDGDPGDTDVNWKHVAKWPDEESLEMSDPTPEEIATLPETLRQRARDRTLTSWLRLELEQTATALASLQRRAETAERERDEARSGSAAPYCWTKQQLYTWWKVQLERANVAESSLADQAKVIEEAKKRPRLSTISIQPTPPSTASPPSSRRPGMDEREEGLGMSDLGDAPSEPGLSPSVEPVPVSPPDGASIPIAEARPRSLTPEMAFRAALKTVADLVAEGLIEDDEAGHAADIAKYGRRGMDGYELAQTLDRSCMWNCDLQMAECLDAFSSYARDEIEAAEKAWAERNSIAAPLPIGAPVKLLRTGELGKIDEVYKHGAAKYCVAIGGEPSNTRRIVNFEDVAAQGIEAERPRPEGARGEAREPGPKDAPKPPSEPLS